MRLISVVVKNYRLHKELKVEFDRSRNIIGGPNETGKSTLFEAIHHALFLKAKGNKQEHRDMQTKLFHGDPEVELVFEARGKRCQLSKRFGSKGSGTLSVEGESTLHNAEAEEKLFSMLGEDAGTNQWAHLWIRQGESGVDPSGYANQQRNELLTQLQKHGAKAAVQSVLDTKIASHFEYLVQTLFTSTDRIKKDSDFGRAEVELQTRREIFEKAKNRLENLDSAAANLENVEKEIPLIESNLYKLKAETLNLEKKEKELRELIEREKDEQHAADISEKKYKELFDTNESIVKRELAIKTAKELIAPNQKKLDDLESALRELKEEVGKAELDYNTEFNAQQKLRDLFDFASISQQFFDYTDQLKNLKRRLTKAQKIQDEISGLIKELSGIVVVEKKDLKKLQDLDAEVTASSAALKAMAAGLEILKLDKEVKVSGKIVEKGEKLILTEDTEIEAGKGLLLRITPGGGTSLAEARKIDSDARVAFQKKLNEVGVKGVSEAARILSVREEIKNKVNALEGQQEDLNVVEIQEEVDALEIELAKVNTRLDALKKRAPGKMPVLTKEGVSDYATSKEEEFEAAERKSNSTKKRWEQQIEKLNEKTELVQKTQSDFQIEKDKLNELTAQYNYMLDTHGSDAVRARKIADAEAEKTRTGNIFQDTKNAIEVLQPDMLAMDRRRIDRAKQVTTERQGELLTQRGIAMALLHSDGRDDPREEYNTAMLRAHMAEDNFMHLQQKATAIKLLDSLFKQEQQALSDQYTRPLAEKIASYLRCLFGAGTSVYMNVEQGEFLGLSLQRTSYNGHTFPFEALSGGTREQVACAVRLAMAEVLAESHEGCLPLVFDDSFVNADPDRTVRLQSMLDLAAEHGLQIIVLTCTPNDYSNLGARLVVLDNQMLAGSLRAGTAENGQLIQMNDEGEYPTESESFPNELVIPDFENLSGQLLTCLRDMNGKSGNQTLCERLGWEEDVYTAVKNRLIENGILKPGKGRGGSISLAEH